MRYVLGFFIAAFAGSVPATAQVHRSYGPVHSSEYYTAESGDRVHRPMHAAHQPAGATARCRDQTWSFSEHRRGTCSHHGGVVRWIR